MAVVADSLFTKNDRATQQLQIALAMMKGGDFDKGENLVNALKLVQDGAVSLVSTGLYTVKGRTQTYKVGALCPCEDATKRKNAFCYHRASVKLYQNWQLHLGDKPMADQSSLALGPATTDERLAQAPHVASTPTQGSPGPSIPLDTPQPLPETISEAVRLPLPLGRMLRPLHAILADLRRPLPDDCVPSYPGPGKTEIDFLPWRHITHLLHTYAPGWYPEVVRIEEMEVLTIVVRVNLLSAEGRTGYEGVGRDEQKLGEKQYGDRPRRAYARAIKHAAQLLGMDWLQEDADKSQTLTALDKYLLKEQTERIQALAAACEKAGLDKAAYMDALQRQACVQKRKDIPVAMLQEALACVEAYAAQEKV